MSELDFDKHRAGDFTCPECQVGYPEACQYESNGWVHMNDQGETDCDRCGDFDWD